MEVRFYFRATIAGSLETLVVCSLFSPADGRLNQETYSALNVFDYHGEESLVAICATTILSVMTMVPFGERVQGRPARFFLVEKFSLGVVDTGIILE